MIRYCYGPRKPSKFTSTGRETFVWQFCLSSFCDYRFSKERWLGTKVIIGIPYPGVPGSAGTRLGCSSVKTPERSALPGYGIPVPRCQPRPANLVGPVADTVSRLFLVRLDSQYCASDRRREKYAATREDHVHCQRSLEAFRSLRTPALETTYRSSHCR